MTDPTFTVLVATIGERWRSFGRLASSLLAQAEPYGGRVTVLAYYSDGQPGLAEIRQRMVEHVAGDYIAWIDDDDMVSDQYVADILGALEKRPDYVGFKVQCYTDGQPAALAHHSLAYGGWHEDGPNLYRDISHVNPVRTDLARKADFRATPPGEPEDRTWVAQMRGLLRTEVVIDKVMYHYLYSPATSVGIGSGRMPRRRGMRLPIDHPQFAYHPESDRG